ncbi:MAG: glycoside hydrolase [Proteobacteria bacterium]|nr:MAG: glycoside hydrolase [Pseudomonadota bacterium]
MFASFFLAGFEGTTAVNRHGEWIDQIAATQHDRFADDDYRLLREVGIAAARDAVRWPLVDRAGRYDWSSLDPLLGAARRHGVDVVWDLFHFGYPAGADPFADGFAERFAEYCWAAGRHVARETPGRCWFTPVNEPSYFAWAAGDAGLFAPHQRGAGYDLKKQLARAAIAGIDALRSACPQAGIVNVDAICRVTAPPGDAALQRAADDFNEHVVFQSYDMLAGRLHPELGGSREHLGAIGINYYWTNQWDLAQPGVPLLDTDPRHVPLREIVRNVWKRYGGDVLVTETSHVGELRPGWLRAVAEEAEALLRERVPLRGVCLYPILGMPEWHERGVWARMGLWDLVPQSPTLARLPYAPMLEALRDAQRLEGFAARA